MEWWTDSILEGAMFASWNVASVFRVFLLCCPKDSFNWKTIVEGAKVLGTQTQSANGYPFMKISDLEVKRRFKVFHFMAPDGWVRYFFFRRMSTVESEIYIYVYEDIKLSLSKYYLFLNYIDIYLLYMYLTFFPFAVGLSVCSSYLYRNICI